MLWKQERSGFGEEVEILLILIFFVCYEFFVVCVCTHVTDRMFVHVLGE